MRIETAACPAFTQRTPCFVALCTQFRHLLKKLLFLDLKTVDYFSNLRCDTHNSASRTYAILAVVLV
jgi:hypothetical protein